MTIDLHGLIPATVLPMTEEARVDEAALRRYVRRVADARPAALAINADSGEGQHLFPDERLRVLELVVDEVGDRLPVIAGLGAAFTEQAVRSARDFASAGASGLLVFPIPAYLGEPLDPEVPLRYHSALAGATDLPLVLFNLHPAFGGTLYQPETVQRLCELAPVAGIKDASFDAQRFVELRQAVEAARPDCVVLTGNDTFILESFVLGAGGGLLGFGSVATEQQVRMVELALAGQYDEARVIMDRLSPLAQTIFAAPMRDYRVRLKEALVVQGILERATVREPLLPIGEAEQARIRDALSLAGELEVAL